MTPNLDFVQMALELGAQDARLVEPRDVTVSDWVRVRCQYGCNYYGKCFLCPPFAPTPDQTRRILSDFSLAVLLKFRPEKPHASSAQYTRFKNFTRGVVANLERELFLNQFYRAFGLHSGPCTLCRVIISEDVVLERPCIKIFPLAKESRGRKVLSYARRTVREPSLIKRAFTQRKTLQEVLNREAWTAFGDCRFPAIARPAMEAMGIDVYATVRKQGWDIRVCTTKEEIPTYFGMVLIE